MWTFVDAGKIDEILLHGIAIEAGSLVAAVAAAATLVSLAIQRRSLDGTHLPRSFEEILTFQALLLLRRRHLDPTVLVVSRVLLQGQRDILRSVEASNVWLPLAHLAHFREFYHTIGVVAFR